ncbi:hypothetical protein [Bacillus cereus]|uniref:hypothetical protein n=1 Tax=Bacillus cereus TaxID=1396 RepID=UPI00159660E6|nr:hypothetical protein [Bacillus cereus]
MYIGNPLVSMTGVASVGILNLLDTSLATMGIAVILAFTTNFALIMRTKQKLSGNT